MAKAIQCPSCGRKHRVADLPDAPTFRCESCGQPLKVPAQFRQSVMDSPRHVRQPDAHGADASAVLPPRPAPAPGPAPAPAPRARSTRPEAEPASTDAVSRPLRILAWVLAMVLGLVITLWVARITGWLSGDRLVDVFTQEGWARYIRVVAVAPVWALFTTLLLTMFLEGGRALARRRAETRAESAASRRDESEPFDAGRGGRSERDGGGAGDGRESRRTAARRGGP